jgi:hypothetical protein
MAVAAPALNTIQYLQGMNLAGCLFNSGMGHEWGMTFFLLRLQKSYSILFGDGLREGRPVAVAAPAFNQLDVCSQQAVCSIQARVIRVLLDIFFVVFPKVLLNIFTDGLRVGKTRGGGRTCIP